jgi:subtilisin family serine protease
VRPAAALAAFAGALILAPTAAARTSFTPTDPLAKNQYYLAQDHAFDAFGDTVPVLSPVRVAVIDSGLDATHPEFQPATRIWAGKSFVGGTWRTDEEGHGTFVTGEIAAALDNGKGIAGIAFSAQLIIAKIAGADASISVRDEAAAIRWAVDHGAQVINLSIGGLRDPIDRSNDTFSPLEAKAVQYAVRRGVVLVAAVGNSDEAPRMPWPWASYPAALPHVIGVSALTQSGSVASFSNRDPIYNDISAPGENIFSTLPLALTAKRPGCVDQGYADCGPDIFNPGAEGTSFAAPQVTAAAALLLAIRPSLKPSQVSTILERSADDVNAANGCRACPVGRDSLTGWGRLDIAKAIAALGDQLPPADRLEPNDDVDEAPVVPVSTQRLKATLDFWDDQVDVYKVRIRRRETVTLGLNGPKGATSNLLLWKPGTQSVFDLRRQSFRVAESIGRGSVHRVVYRAPATGWYYVEAKLATRGAGPYVLTIRRQ